MRFIDGDLPPSEWSDIVAEAVRDPDLAQRLEAFRFTKEELAGAFAPTLEVPPRLIEKILRRTAPASRTSRWYPSFVAPAGLTTPKVRLQAIASAATLALLAGAAGWILRESVRPDYAGLIAPPSFQRALEETSSGASAKLSGDLSIRPASTFSSIQKRWCREYVLINGNRLGATALACRGDDGIWRVEAQENPPAAPYPKDPTAYVPAGKTQAPGASGAESVAEHRDRIMSADLSLEEEAELIKARWQRKP